MLAAVLVLVAPTAFGAPKLALIIDDLGYNLARAERAMALPGPPTAAVLPFAAESRAVADYARSRGADVLLHQPMESIGAPSVTRGMLTSTMSPEELAGAFAEALDSLPEAVGVSNHEGSLLTTKSDAMALVMIEIKSRGLLFVDSRTTTETVALDVARSAGIPSTRRDVFLDNELDARAIAAQFDRAVGIAKKRGHVVVIAHPHDVTLDYLEHALATTDDELTTIQALLDESVPRAVLTPLRNTSSGGGVLVEPALRGFELQRALVERTADDRTENLPVARTGVPVQRLDVREVRDTP